ncbi:hypothetical protein PENSPDRAFT_758879 [Peniophora sp. CONT]|nr:hypothetical protein PENSPDRAFT_758879 [Peniophora sp. CONT]
MSSASPSPTTSAGTPFFSNGSGDNGNGGGGGGGTSSSLYLFTFLATLLLLLCVSSAIILRSFILRRRFRRHVEEAFYAGVWAGGDMPPGFPGSAGANKKNNVGPRPVMFDAYVAKKAEHEKWDDVQPVSALAVLPPAVPSNTSTPNLLTGTPQPISSLPPPRGLARLLPSRFIYPHQDQSQTEMTSPISAGSAAPTPESVQVALLVAMPDARRAAASETSDGRDGEELPELVLGVRKVEYREGVRT